MSVICISGVPGSGKTLLATHLMMKKYKKDNSLLKKIFHKCRGNLVMTNYPVKLHKYIYSLSFNRNYFNDFLHWPKHISIVLDEFQAVYCDSLDYLKFPRRAANNFQFHRHFGIDDIYLISQSPSRIPKTPRELCCEFWKIKKFHKFFGIGIISIIKYFDFETYGSPIPKNKDLINFDYKKKLFLFSVRKVFNAYDTCYLHSLVKDKPYLELMAFKSPLLDYENIVKSFNIDLPATRFDSSKHGAEKVFSFVN